ncbi:type II toxin-antitoxin system RelB/DinJ family antitoxin [Comamonas sp. J-3]|uniref:type II toxin-antitoxin system RelB/DinJ family antitoxin n=1 Tax=Comamonas trifloxystrobinivorans TaxID=3350256 RepID=UPI003726262E
MPMNTPAPSVASKPTRKSAEVRSRIEPELKEKSVEILASVGLDLSDAIRLFLRKVVDENGLPFAVGKPNATTRAAMAEALARSGPRFKNADGLFDELEAAPQKQKKSSA